MSLRMMTIADYEKKFAPFKIIDMTGKEKFNTLAYLNVVFREEPKTENKSLRRFGSYIVTGELFLISKVYCSKVSSWLYWNKFNKSFLLVKQFNSGKYHIDFFKNSSMMEYVDFENGQSIIEIAYCEKYDDSAQTKSLYFDFDKKCFRVDAITPDKTFSTDFNIMEG